MCDLLAIFLEDPAVPKRAPDPSVMWTSSLSWQIVFEDQISVQYDSRIFSKVSRRLDDPVIVHDIVVSGYAGAVWMSNTSAEYINRFE